MELVTEWSLVKDPGWVLIGKQFEPGNQRTRHKVAMFDLNLTVLISKSGTLHGINEHDWTWWHKTVPARLKALDRQGYIVVIISNQGRLTTVEGEEAAEAKPFKRKMEMVMKELGFPVTTMVACANDICRKPRVGMWSLLGDKLDTANSFVVGDAAGRQRDFSDSDLHLALNLGVEFHTPEVFFKGEPAEELGHIFNPELYLGRDINGDVAPKELPLVLNDDQQLLVLIGLPGSGKSTYYHHYLTKYDHILLSSPSAEEGESSRREAEQCLALGKTVVIDDWNLSKEARKTWLGLAEEHQVPAVAVNFTAPKSLCLHNDAFRALAGPKYNPEQRPIFPKLRFLELLPTYERPTVEEGFAKVVDVDFQWQGTEQDAAVWGRYWD